MDISGSTCLITGGAGGFGAACARRLAEAGAQIVIADLNEQAGQLLAAGLGSSVRFVRCDVTRPDDAQRAIDVAVRDFGELHCLVQCAGVVAGARIAGKEGPHDLKMFERVIQVNLIGTFNVMRLATAAMIINAPNAAGERGVIVNTSSVAALEGQIGQAAYAASKGGVASLTLPAARELARFGIRVVAIAPGTFDTEMMAGMTDEIRQSLEAAIPFPKRMGKPDEFAQLVQSVIENAYLNGALIRLDAALRMN